MKSLFEVCSKHIHFMNRTRRTLLSRFGGLASTTSRKLAYIVCLAPILKSDFKEKFRRLVVTKLDNYFTPFSAFYFIC